MPVVDAEYRKAVRLSSSEGAHAIKQDVHCARGTVIRTRQSLRETAARDNFSFTTELHYPFTYHAASVPTLTVTADDDVWTFIDGHLAVDMGGTHRATTGSVTLDSTTAATLGLADAGVYSIDVFKAERHTCGSSYTLTLNGFVHTTSVCAPAP